MPTAAEAVPDQSEAAFQAATGTNAYAADDVSVAAASDRAADMAAPDAPAQAPAQFVRTSNPASRASNSAPDQSVLASRPFADDQLLAKLQQQLYLLRQPLPAALTAPLLAGQGRAGQGRAGQGSANIMHQTRAAQGLWE